MLTSDNQSGTRTSAQNPASSHPVEFDGYWLHHDTDTGEAYASFYDVEARQVRRERLGQLDPGEAFLALKAFAASRTRAQKYDDTASLPLVAVMDEYLRAHADGLPSAYQARRAINALVDWLEIELSNAGLTVREFGQAAQEDLIKWSSGKLGHKPSTIARNMNVFSAALHFAAKPRLIADEHGRKTEQQLISSAPKVNFDEKKIANLLRVPIGRPDRWVPTFQQMVHFLETLEREHLKRFAILSIALWGRPEAITDFRMRDQVDWDRGFIDLNPPGRAQTKKYRPVVRLGRVLATWLREWKSDPILLWKGAAIESVKQGIRRHGDDCGLPEFTQVTFRHWMATTIRSLCPDVPREERSIWLGHRLQEGSRTTGWYEHLDPGYLARCRDGIDFVFECLSEPYHTVVVPQEYSYSHNYAVRSLHLTRFLDAQKPWQSHAAATGPGENPVPDQ
jgi:hypothetical protein